jgi:predicted Zn-dependent protease
MMHAFETLTIAYAKLCIREQRHQEAVGCIHSVISAAPEYPGARVLLLRAEALLKGEDPDAAVAADAEEEEA